MSAKLVDIIKAIARDQNYAERPVNLMFGTVLTEEPDLSVQIDQKRILTKEFLVVPRHLTDHNVDMTVDHWTEDADPTITDNADNTSTSTESGGGGDAAFAPHAHTHSHKHEHSHKHPYKGRKTFLVHEKLLAGEKVILASVQGGQKYVLLDRIGSNLDDTNQSSPE